MAQKFIGFNTQDQFKKFTLTGFELVKRDLLNAFNIQQGQLPGRPGYGTIIWTYLFENQLQEVQTAIQREIQSRFCAKSIGAMKNLARDDERFSIAAFSASSC